MKFLMIFALMQVTVFGLPSKEIKPRNIVVSAGSPEGRITNGVEAPEKKFPYQAGMVNRHENGRYTWCGACVISTTTILTAAHCVQDVVSVKVIMGTNDRLIPKVEREVTKEKITIHPDWNKVTLENDIAIIRVPPIEYSDYIQPAKLPAKDSINSTYVGETVVASGWGRKIDSIPGPTTFLQYATFSVISNELCSSYYVLYRSNLCVSTKGGASTSKGDSGGPLVVPSSNTLVGITSFSGEVAYEKNIPAVFTRITSFLDWIWENCDVDP